MSANNTVACLSQTYRISLKTKHIQGCSQACVISSVFLRCVCARYMCSDLCDQWVCVCHQLFHQVLFTITLCFAHRAEKLTQQTRLHVLLYKRRPTVHFSSSRTDFLPLFCYIGTSSVIFTYHFHASRGGLTF